MAEKNIYCGANNTPKGKKKGSMTECAKKGQIRLFGLKRIDPLTAKKIKEDKKKAVDEAKAKMKTRFDKIIDNMKKNIEKKKEKLETENLKLREKLKKEEKEKEALHGKDKIHKKVKRGKGSYDKMNEALATLI